MDMHMHMHVQKKKKKKKPLTAFAFVVVLCTMTSLRACDSQTTTAAEFDVLSYGAIGDGTKDDTPAFIAAWGAACGAQSDPSSSTTLRIPEGYTFLLNPVTFQGPCQSSTIQVEFQGDIIAPDMSSWTDQSMRNWVVFADVNGLIVRGNGQLDGRGSAWWEKSGVNTDDERPKALAFHGCSNVELNGLRLTNSPKGHISISRCTGLTISNIQITAPEDSPNTDGADISHSTNIQIRDCVMATGDDCVAINGGSSHIIITGVACGPGHGISIGSLGEDGQMDTVEDVHVSSCSFTGTTNGARIKTWQGGSGYARQISFQDITLTAVARPIIIDQFYCKGGHSCKNDTRAVQVSDVTYDGFHGTSSTEDAIKISCSDTVPCSNIVLRNININSADSNKPVFSSCFNAQGTCMAVSPAVDCLPNLPKGVSNSPPMPPIGSDSPPTWTPPTDSNSPPFPITNPNSPPFPPWGFTTNTPIVQMASAGALPSSLGLNIVSLFILSLLSNAVLI